MTKCLTTHFLLISGLPLGSTNSLSALAYLGIKDLDLNVWETGAFVIHQITLDSIKEFGDEMVLTETEAQ